MLEFAPVWVGPQLAKRAIKASIFPDLFNLSVQAPRLVLGLPIGRLLTDWGRLSPLSRHLRECSQLGLLFLQLSFERLHLALQCDYDRALLHELILLGDELHLRGSLGELKGAESLEEIDAGRRDGADDRGERVAAERVLQDAGKLGVAVRDVGRVALGQFVDHKTQCEERLIDMRRFVLNLLLQINVVKSFAACQVYQVQRRVVYLLLITIGVGPAVDCFLDEDSENGVAARAMLMNVSFLVNSVLLAEGHKAHSLLKGLNLLLRQSHNVGAEVRVADDFEVLVVFIEEVVDCLIINLKV